GSGTRWKSSFIARLLPQRKSCKPPNRAQKFFARERLGHVTVCALLLAPILVARRVFRRHQNHWDAVELRVALQVAADLESIAVRHHHIEKDYARALGSDGLFDSHGVV